MAISKDTQEKQELFKTIWNVANDLRGSVDGWDFKSYVLNTLFYRYLSEYLAEYINSNERKAGNADFRYEDLDDSLIDKDANFKDMIVKEKGFFLYPSQLFCNVRKNASNDDDLNITLSEVFSAIEASSIGYESEPDFKGLFNDFDLNSKGKLGATVQKRNEKLASLLNRIGDIDFGSESWGDNKSDVFGDCYEMLMSLYAANAGKSGGEYFTPQSVSNLLARISLDGRTKVNKVYDPACGSGSLLLQTVKEIGKDGVDIGFFGQEINPTTYNACRANMILHGIRYDKFDIQCDDTLINPMHWDEEPFEMIVSNPPYSIKWKGDADPTLINDPRFSGPGVLAPKSKADFAFVLHSLSWLAPTGVAAIVTFPGIFYRGGAEQKIRKYLIDNNNIDAVIQLPSNLFYGTSIATCIMVMKKNKTDNKVLFIDASKEFEKDTNNNILTDKNIENIMKVYEDRKDVQYISKLASYDEIVENKYNLSVSTYVEKEDTREKIEDIKAFHKELKAVVQKEDELRKAIDDIIYQIEGAI